MNALNITPENRGYIDLLKELESIPEERERIDHETAVQELIGDLSLTEALREQAQRELQEAKQKIKLIPDEEDKSQQAAETIVTRFETQGFVLEAPKFADQAVDDSRTNIFRYNRQPYYVKGEDWQENQMTETEGLEEMNEFLNLFLEITHRRDGSYVFPNDAKKATSLLDNMTFIGEKEYKEGVLGLAAAWKNYLDVDPTRKICVLAGISNSKKYPGQRKSDDYLRDRILQTFTDNELEKYSGRIVDNPHFLQGDEPKNVRVILLDDWTISGTQLRREYADLTTNHEFRKYKDSIEINLLVASEGHIQNGLQKEPHGPKGASIKVRSYFKSHHAENATNEHKGHVSGLHSTVNYDFEDILDSLVHRFETMGIQFDFPALASIVRPYRKERPAIKISNDRLAR